MGVNRRGFLAGLFGTTAVATVVTGRTIAGDAFSDLTPEEQVVFKELQEKHIIQIPSRKSNLMTPELWEKRRILKRLVHKNRIGIDFYVASPNDETSATCLVFFMPSPGKTPLDMYEK